MQNTISNTVLCICTRNRPEYVQSLLQSFRFLTAIPKKCLVIDSSDNDETEKNIFKIQNDLTIEIQLIKSLPGLPHQRNIAIQYIKNQSLLSDEGIVSFLDDDVRVSSNYFEKVRELFSENATAVNIGGYFKDSIPNGKRSLFRRMALTSSSKNGIVLSSGFATLPIPTSKATETKWIPGGAQNIKMGLFHHLLFDGRIRMYGEDLEFCLRASQYGKILCSDELLVTHLAADEAKDDFRSIESFTDGFRWSLAVGKQSNVTKPAVIYSTVLLVFAETFLAIAKIDRGYLGKVCGHFDFFRNVIFNREYQQKVDHDGSGPNT